MAVTLPPSAKAVLLRDGAVLLGRNARGEDELPGGRPEPGEQLEDAVVREVREEAGLSVRVARRLGERELEVLPGRRVRLVAFACEEVGPRRVPAASSEHTAVRFVPADDLDRLPLPEPYRQLIDEAARSAGRTPAGTGPRDAVRVRLADAALPDTPAVTAAGTVAVRYLTPSLVAHSVRSWYWAVGFADLAGLRPDRELLAVAALLHDIGLAAEFDTVRVPYETAGGHVAAVLGAGAGWPEERRRRVVEVVERHNHPEVDPAVDVEGHLLEIATGLDISGARPHVLPREYLREVLAAFPRGDLARDFGDRVAEQAERKPGSHAARIVAGGLVERLAHHPLDRL